MASRYQLAWPPVTRNFKIVAALLVLGFLLPFASESIRAFVDAQLVMSGALLQERYGFWSIASYGLFHENLGALLIDLVIFYLFGAEVDQRMSNGRWWGMVLGSLLLGGALAALGQFLLAGTPIMGFGAAVTAAAAAYCWYSWDRPLNMIIVELSGKSLLAIFLALQLVFAIATGEPARFGLHLGGAIVGLWASAGGDGFRQMRASFHHWRIKRKLSVVTRSPEDPPGKPKRKRGKEWIN